MKSHEDAFRIDETHFCVSSIVFGGKIVLKSILDENSLIFVIFYQNWLKIAYFGEKLTILHDWREFLPSPTSIFFEKLQFRRKIMAMYPKTLQKEAFLREMADKVRKSKAWKAYEGFEDWASRHAKALGFGGIAVGAGASPTYEMMSTLRRGYKAEKVLTDAARGIESPEGGGNGEDVRAVAD